MRSATESSALALVSASPKEDPFDILRALVLFKHLQGDKLLFLVTHLSRERFRRVTFEEGEGLRSPLSSATLGSGDPVPWVSSKSVAPAHASAAVN